MAIIAGVTFGIAFSQVKVGTKAQKRISFHPGVVLLFCNSISVYDCKLTMVVPKIIQRYFVFPSADRHVAGLLSVQDHHSQSV